MKLYVSNLTSSSSGRPVANQFEIYLSGPSGRARLFQSYQTLISLELWEDGNYTIYFTDAHDYSVTTSKYCTQASGKDLDVRRSYLERHPERLLTEEEMSILFASVTKEPTDEV